MAAMVKQISLMCLLTAVAEHLLKEKTSFACLHMIIAGRIAFFVFSFMETIVQKCGL